ncbi:MAG: hypothetical protein ACE5GT_02845 [Rhodospirillales bacterium]
MHESKSQGEIMRNALRLVSTRGPGALEYANKMVARMGETGDEQAQAFWEKISKQVELLLYENE